MQTNRSFDLKTFLIMLGAAVLGGIWANYNRILAAGLSGEAALRPNVWAVFALPFALFIGWLIARRHEGWLAFFVCFCLYFFSTFIAARYESCTVVTGQFNLAICFANTAEAQTAAQANHHEIYFLSILVIQSLAALATALQRALSRSTMPDRAQQQPNPEISPNRPA